MRARTPRLVAALLAIVVAVVARLALAADYDVVVVGGGPAGLAAAIEAKKNGAQKVIVIEKRGRERGRVQMLNFQPGTLHNLAGLGVEMKPDQNITFLKRKAALLSNGATALEEKIGAVKIDAGRARHTIGDMLRGNARQAAIMSTNALEAELISAAEKAGVELLFDTDVAAVGHAPHEAWAEIAGKRISGEMLVISDGAHSNARKSLGIRTVTYGKKTRLMGGVFSTPGQHEVLSAKNREGGENLGVAKLGGHATTGVLAEVPTGTELADEASRNAWLGTMAKKVGTEGALLYPAGEFDVQLSNAERVVEGERIFLIGDAARTTHVFTGLGVNWALRDAARFGELVRRVLRSPGGRRKANSWFSKETMAASYRLHQRAWKVFDNRLAKGIPAGATPSRKEIRLLGQAH